MLYDVEIRVIIRKIIRVDARNEHFAAKHAHENFSIENDGHYEDYDERILSIAEVEDDLL